MQPASRARRRSPFDYGMMTRCGLLVLALAIPALMLVGLDAWLSSNPAIAGFFGPYRSRLLFTLRTNVTEAKQSAEHALHQLSPNLAAANRTSAAQKANPDTTLTSTDSPSTDPIPVPHTSMPYVTIGLTRDEVITVMGRPGSSTPDTMRDKTAVFYFNKGLVAGWQVDPTLIPLRVKLWPSGPIDPRLQASRSGLPETTSSPFKAHPRCSPKTSSRTADRKSSSKMAGSSAGTTTTGRNVCALCLVEPMQAWQIPSNFEFRQNTGPSERHCMQ